MKNILVSNYTYVILEVLHIGCIESFTSSFFKSLHRVYRYNLLLLFLTCISVGFDPPLFLELLFQGLRERKRLVVMPTMVVRLDKCEVQGCTDLGHRQYKIIMKIQAYINIQIIKEMKNVFMTIQLQRQNAEIGNLPKQEDLPTVGEKSPRLLQQAFQKFNGQNLQVFRKHRYISCTKYGNIFT